MEATASLAWAPKWYIWCKTTPHPEQTIRHKSNEQLLSIECYQVEFGVIFMQFYCGNS